MKKLRIIEPTRQQILQEMKSKIRVCAYCRVSTDSTKQHTSFVAQVTHYKGYIENHDGWEYAGIFADESSGTKSETREEFNRMIQACEQGEIDLVITKSLTRFARNTVTSMETVRKLKTMGVGVYFEKERINSLSAQSEVMMSVLSAIAQSESENLSQNIRWGIQKRFQDGTYILSSAPYGYEKTADGALALDSEQAPIVRRIFEEYLNGYGVYAIAKMLTAEGIPTSRGAEKWNDGVVKEILQNPVYYGELRLQKTYTTQGFPFARKRNHGEVQQYSVVENHPAIVSVEEFQQVHEIAKYRREQSKFDGTSFLKRYPFSGKLVCDQCGSTFRRQKLSTGKPYESVQWCCKTHIIDKEKCPRKAVKECVIENAFQSMWNKLVCNQCEILEPLLVGLKEYQRGQVAEQIEELDQRIDEVIERSRILSRVLDKGYVDSALFMSQQTELNVQLEEYKKQRNMLLKSCDLAKEIDGTLHIIEIIKHNPKPIFTYQASIFEAVVTKVVMGESSITFQLINGLNLREEW